MPPPAQSDGKLSRPKAHYKHYITVLYGASDTPGANLGTCTYAYSIQIQARPGRWGSNFYLRLQSLLAVASLLKACPPSAQCFLYLHAPIHPRSLHSAQKLGTVRPYVQYSRVLQQVRTSRFRQTHRSAESSAAPFELNLGRFARARPHLHHLAVYITSPAQLSGASGLSPTKNQAPAPTGAGHGHFCS